jgi:hypothetical protein
MRRHIGRRRHHHRVSMLHLRALMIVRMCVRRDRRGRHRLPWASTVRWRRVRAWCVRLHISLGWSCHLHTRRLDRFLRWHTRGVGHRRHVRTLHIRTRRPRGSHTRHHVVRRIPIWRVCVNVCTRLRLLTIRLHGSVIFVWRRWHHRGRNRRRHVRAVRLGRVLDGEHLHVALPGI